MSRSPIRACLKVLVSGAALLLCVACQPGTAVLWSVAGPHAMWALPASTPVLASTPVPPRADPPPPSPFGSEPDSVAGGAVPPEFPDASTTGVPDGVVLRDVGSVTVSEDGAVIDALRVSGSVTVDADDVTIRRSLIRNNGLYAIRVLSGHRGLLVEDVEIDGAARGSAAVCCSGYTLRRVNVHDVTEGPRLGSDSAIYDSFIHSLHRCTGCHIDALQSTGGIGIVVEGNNLQAYNAETGDFMNAAFQFGTTQGPISDAIVRGNLMNGGNFTVNGGGGGTSDATVSFRDNRFGRDFRFGPIGNLGPNVSFDLSNVFHDTGSPVRPGS